MASKALVKTALIFKKGTFAAWLLTTSSAIGSSSMAMAVIILSIVPPIANIMLLRDLGVWHPWLSSCLPGQIAHKSDRFWARLSCPTAQSTAVLSLGQLGA